MERRNAPEFKSLPGIDAVYEKFPPLRHFRFEGAGFGRRNLKFKVRAAYFKGAVVAATDFGGEFGGFGKRCVGTVNQREKIF